MPRLSIPDDVAAKLKADLAKLKPGHQLHVRFDGCEYLFMLTNLDGFHTGRPRYLVACNTHDKVLHPATTGPDCRMLQHAQQQADALDRRPIPLTSPDGQVYAYACGMCHHVAGGSSVFYAPDKPGPIDVLVESSLFMARQCCSCLTCKQPLPKPTYSELGTKGAPLGRYACIECEWWSAFLRIWGAIDDGVVPNQWLNGPLTCEICRGPMTNFCRTTPKCIDCDEEHGTHPDGRCRDCYLDEHYRQNNEGSEGHQL